MCAFLLATSVSVLVYPWAPETYFWMFIERLGTSVHFFWWSDVVVDPPCQSDTVLRGADIAGCPPGKERLFVKSWVSPSASCVSLRLWT